LDAGEYRVTVTGLPPGFVVRSLTAGNIDLTSQPLKLGASGNPPILVTIGTGPNSPWVKVNGRLTGRPPAGIKAMGLLLEDAVSVPVQPDGSFQFQKLLPGEYSLVFPWSGLPDVDVLREVDIVVGDTDLAGIEIAAPPIKRIAGKVAIDGAGWAPASVAFDVDWKAVGRVLPPGSPLAAGNDFFNARISVKVLPDGSFTIPLPEGEVRLTISPDGLPPGYSLHSIRYGSADLLSDPLRIVATDSTDLIGVQVSVSPQ
jgi:hypothetical protein